MVWPRLQQQNITTSFRWKPARKAKNKSRQLYCNARARRPFNMFRNLRNPSENLSGGGEFGLSKQDPLLLKLRNGVVAGGVTQRLLQTFKESVFAEDYICSAAGRHHPDRQFRQGRKRVLDVGANAGYFSALVAVPLPPAPGWWQSSPVPNNFAQLCRNTELNPG